LHVERPLAADEEFALAPVAARHVQVLRLQPGAALLLFDGRGGEWNANVLKMGRNDVWVQVGAHRAVERELACRVTLALAMPTNDRMDMLVEKATELGVAELQPLVSERSVLRLDGERAQRRQLHWQGIAVAACEQCGRTRVPSIAPVLALPAWLAALDAAGGRLLLSTGAAPRWAGEGAATPELLVLSGPEGGFSADEEQAALRHGFRPVSLGPRVLRADTAPLALLAALALAV
jgi:16S rRNA (uracil1498-N3)-methyltransferase